MNPAVYTTSHGRLTVAKGVPLSSDVARGTLGVVRSLHSAGCEESWFVHPQSVAGGVGREGKDMGGRRRRGVGDGVPWLLQKIVA